MSKFMSVPGAGWTSNNFFQLGKGKTLAIPMEVHAASRKKLIDLFKLKGISEGVIILQGGDQECQYDSDSEVLFRQDSWFNYLFGVKEAGLFGAISISSGKSAIFIPKLPAEYKIWCGEIYPPEHFAVSYAVEEAFYTEDLNDWTKKNLGESGFLYMLQGVNSDSGLSPKPISFPENFDKVSVKFNHDVLYNILAECRVIKSVDEIEVMRYCAIVASNAHVEVMRSAKNCEFEYELEAKFLYEIYKNGGCRRCAYTSICACGPNSAVLHYGHAGAPNDRKLHSNDIALLDMGAEYHGYVSDITCSFPVSGKFSNDQKAIYEAVLAAQIVVFENMKPGVAWTECHRLAQLEILKALANLGILQNGTLEDFENNNLGPVFFPHGLGHLIGCDTHDVGGYIPGTPARSQTPGLNKLRTARVLQPGMVLTNEPGCYFVDWLLDQALMDPVKSKFLNSDVLNRFRGFGGVRLEDVVLVTENGAECLSNCPRTVEEVENVLSGGQWPPLHDKAPQLKRKWTKLGPDCTNMVEFSVQL